ncbi:kynureninase [Halobacteriales archaeon QH_9_66_26]|nr:MAG: kynureninase [Halobacteriales archaeon QH_9_66_26]
MNEGFEPGRAYAERRDRDDPLSWCRERFAIPDGIYLDGNSLGPLSADAERALVDAIEEWRELGIGGWTDAEPPWFRYGERLGDRLAPLVGAREPEVVVANSTTVNPTDHYAIRAQFRGRGIDPDEGLVVVGSDDGRTIDEERVVRAMDDEDVAILFMPSVLYRSGQLLDVESLTRAAHERDVLAGFDLAHSIGVVPHDLAEWEVDFAVWCSYKYLNAGPGAIAGLYVNEEHFGATPALAGWWGHEKATQFDMNPQFTPAANAGAYQIGTVPILSAAPLDGTLDLIQEVGIDAIRERSLALTSYLVALVDERLGDAFECAVGTPRDPDRRGGHVAVEHPDAERIAQALTDGGVVVDFRPPNVVRMCPSPLYTSYADVWDAIERWRAILDTGAHERFDADRSGVT